MSNINFYRTWLAQKPQSYRLLALIAILAITFAASLFQFLEATEASKEFDAMLSAELNRQQTLENSINAISERLATENQTLVSELALGAKNTPKLSTLMIKLSSLTPTELWLTNIQFDANGQHDFSGLSTTPLAVRQFASSIQADSDLQAPINNFKSTPIDGHWAFELSSTLPEAINP